MDDPVNHPTHYNRQGIEVLDVIEAYDLPYHLGNVIKYVLRHQYKGHPEQDLRKAQYYLNRYLSEFFDTEAIAEKDELYRSFREDEGSPETGAHWENGVGARTSRRPGTRVELPKERIAGSTDAAQDIKNEYYTHDPFLIAGYCTSCDKELQVHRPVLQGAHGRRPRHRLPVLLALVSGSVEESARPMKFHCVTTDAKQDRLLKHLAEHDRCGFDTEAVGPRRRYTKANPKAFMNVSMSALQGASWGFPNGECFYLPLRHKGPNAKFRWFEEAIDHTDEMQRVWAHNVKFDSRMLTQEGYDHSGWSWMDSMLAAWMRYSKSSGIGLKQLAKERLDRDSPAWEGSLIDKSAAEVLDYVCHDALNTLELGELLFEELTPRLQKWLKEVDTPIAVILGDMEREGIPIDLDKLEATMGVVADKHLEKATKAWDQLANGVSYSSPAQLQEFFTDGTWKAKGKTSTGAFKAGKDVIEFNVHNAQTQGGRELASLCLELRAAAKVRGTYLDGFYDEMRQWPDRRIHPELNQIGTRTTRFSSANPNIQNQLSHGEYAPLLRDCYVAPPGWLYAAADYSQQEPRIFAELAGPGALQDIFKEEKDLHQEMADAIGGTRDEGKTFNMGFLLYGGSATKASREFGWTRESAQGKIDAAFERFPESPRFRKAVCQVAENRDPWPYVRIKSGHRRWVPELVPHKWAREDHEAFSAKADYLSKKYGIDRDDYQRLVRAIRSSGERIALNTIIQGSGAAMSKLAMVEFEKLTRGDDKVRLVTMTHDELVIMAHEDHVEGYAHLLARYDGGSGHPGWGTRSPFPPNLSGGNHGRI